MTLRHPSKLVGLTFILRSVHFIFKQSRNLDAYKPTSRFFRNMFYHKHKILLIKDDKFYFIFCVYNINIQLFNVNSILNVIKSFNYHISNKKYIWMKTIAAASEFFTDEIFLIIYHSFSKFIVELNTAF